MTCTGGLSQTIMVKFENQEKDFPVFFNNQISNIQLDHNDHEVIKIAAELLTSDINAVAIKSRIS